jgi:DNA repair/transcription protein MET18/MMS19
MTAADDVNHWLIISSEISADRTSLVNVVKALGEYLTANEEDLRRKGMPT